MYILNQSKTDLYNLELILDTRVVLGEDCGRIFLNADSVGYFSNKETAAQVYRDIVKWISDPVINGIKHNVFCIPEDK